MKEILTISGITKSFGKNKALDGIELAIPEKGIVSIIGPSGSGKTTLLRIIAGLEQQDSGTMLFSGKPPKIGIVFQDFNLWPHKTVLENIIEAPVVVGNIPTGQAAREAEALLEKVGMAGKAHSYPMQLSGGERQRAAIARALAMKPQMILFDEITSNLDPEMIGSVNKVIRTLADDGLTLIIVSHDIFFVEEISDKVFFIDKGKLIESGAASELLTNPVKERTRQFLARILNR